MLSMITSRLRNLSFQAALDNSLRGLEWGTLVGSDHIIVHEEVIGNFREGLRSAISGLSWSTGHAVKSDELADDNTLGWRQRFNLRQHKPTLSTAELHSTVNYLSVVSIAST